MRNQNNFEMIALMATNEYILTTEEDIIFCSSEGNYCSVYLQNGKKVTICKKLKEIENQLSDESFLRVHHSYLVNLKHAVKFSKKDGWSVTLSNGSSITVSRRKREVFMSKIRTI